MEEKVLTVRVPRVKVGGKVAGSTKNCKFPITRYGCLSCALSASGCGRAQGHVCCCCSATGSHTSVNNLSNINLWLVREVIARNCNYVLYQPNIA